ncbi:bactofilin family protein [Thiolinea disciformis]|uniref:bactofilin family protein n=1 Tax=Thiolinea disciformis TaxID=125614 RepID=UPI00036EC223|nr:polymer-forming cytoskeletal protein [Thiolinea disciformis]
MFGKSSKGNTATNNTLSSPAITTSAPLPAPLPPAPSHQQQNEPIKSNRSARVDTLIGRGTTIDGDLHFSGNLNVEGVIKGNLTADNDDSTLILSEQGRIQGEVRVSSMLLNGAIDGDVFANGKVELFEKARICGDVYYNLLEMAVGAEVNGKLVRQKPTDAPRPAPMSLPHQSSTDES